MHKKYQIDNYMPVVNLPDKEEHYNTIKEVLSQKDDLQKLITDIIELQKLLIEKRKLFFESESYTKNFFDNYFKLIEKEKNTEGWSDTKRQGFVNTNKNRFNKILQKLNYRITTDFVIEFENKKPNLHNLILRIKPIFENKRFLSVKLFDYYKEDQLNNTQKDNYIRLIGSVLKNGTDVEIVTGLNNKGTSFIYASMVDMSQKFKAAGTIKIKYLNKKIYDFTSLIYVLLESSESRIIGYYEPTTNWLVTEELCSKKNTTTKMYDEFKYTFYDLLEERFNKHYQSEKAVLLNDVYNDPTVDTNRLTISILDKLKKSLNKNMDDLVIKKDILRLFALDTTKDNTKILSSLEVFIRMLKKHENEGFERDSNSMSMFLTQLIKSGLFSSVRKYVMNHSILKEYTTLNNNIFDGIDNVAILFHSTECFNENQTLPSLIETLKWNNEKTIFKSLQTIIYDPELLIDVLLCSNHEVENAEEIENKSYAELVIDFFSVLRECYNLKIDNQLDIYIDEYFIKSYTD